MTSKLATKLAAETDTNQKPIKTGVDASDEPSAGPGTNGADSGTTGSDGDRPLGKDYQQAPGGGGNGTVAGGVSTASGGGGEGGGGGGGGGSTVMIAVVAVALTVGLVGAGVWIWRGTKQGGHDLAGTSASALPRWRCALWCSTPPRVLPTPRRLSWPAVPFRTASRFALH